MSIALGQVRKVRAGRKSGLPGHAQGAAGVGLFAALWTQLIAAVTLVLMWFAWQDPRNLAWPEPDRLFLLALSHISVLIVSLVLSSRFGRRRAAEREPFREIWWTGGAALGTWFGLPLYLSVTWDHLIYGGHDAGTIITVGLIFMAVGGMLGGLLALLSEPVARWLYERVQKRAARREQVGQRGWFRLATPLTLALGGGLTLGLLWFGPHPLTDKLYPGATYQASRSVVYGCQGSLDTYRTSDTPAQVTEYYRRQADSSLYHSSLLPGQVQAVALVPPDLLQNTPSLDPTSLSVVRYSNNVFTSNAVAFDPANDACRSVRVYLSPVAGSSGTLLQIVHERPLHLHTP